MIKYAVKLKTRSGMVIDDLQISAGDRAEAERKVSRIYQRCEIIDCTEQRPTFKNEDFDLESVINLIGNEGVRERPE